VELERIILFGAEQLILKGKRESMKDGNTF
jgi:hypothetical protein